MLCVVVETAVIFSKSLTAHHSRDNCTRHTQTWHVEGERRACFNNQPSPDLPVAQSHLNPPNRQAKHLTLAYHVANGVQKNMPKQVKRTSLLPISDLH